ncbi:MAG: hypothetical protein AAFO03_11600 [Bacteroidota bacterium]
MHAVGRRNGFLFTTIFSLTVLFLSVMPQSANAQLALLDKKKSTTCVDKEFTVMAHMVRDTFQNIGTSVANVEAALELVNLWFEPICVRFVLAETDTVDNFQYSIPFNFNETEELWNNHNEENRINLYLVTDVSLISPKPVFATEDGILQRERGGILINSGALNGNPIWLVNAFGTYCGLKDTNTDFLTQIVTDPNCEFTGDEICDTPADPLDPAAPLGGFGTYFDAECRFIFTGVDTNGEFYLTQTGNLMSRYPTACWCGLTFGQFEHMAEVIARSPLW